MSHLDAPVAGSSVDSEAGPSRSQPGVVQDVRAPRIRHFNHKGKAPVLNWTTDDDDEHGDIHKYMDNRSSEQLLSVSRYKVHQVNGRSHRTTSSFSASSSDVSNRYNPILWVDAEDSSSSPFNFKPSVLSSLVDPKNLDLLEHMGGAKGLLRGLGVNEATGLYHEPQAKNSKPPSTQKLFSLLRWPTESIETLQSNWHRKRKRDSKALRWSMSGLNAPLPVSFTILPTLCLTSVGVPTVQAALPGNWRPEHQPGRICDVDSDDSSFSDDNALEGIRVRFEKRSLPLPQALSRTQNM